MLEIDLIHKKLWEASNTLRGHLDCNEFKEYILPILFYRYLSENTSIIDKEEFKYDSILKSIHSKTFNLENFIKYVESLDNNFKGLFNNLYKCKIELIYKLFLIINDIDLTTENYIRRENHENK